MCGIILVAFVILVGGLVLMVDSQQRGAGGAATWLARLVCFGSLLVVGYFVWLLRLLRTDRISVFTVYDNGLVFGTGADPFTMRLAVAQRAVIPWGDIAELRERGPRSKLLRVLLPPGRRYRLDVITRGNERLEITGAIQNARELADMIRARVG